MSFQHKKLQHGIAGVYDKNSVEKSKVFIYFNDMKLTIILYFYYDFVNLKLWLVHHYISLSFIFCLVTYILTVSAEPKAPPKPFLTL